MHDTKLVKQAPVNIGWQIVFMFIPFVWIYAFYRIEKLRRGLGLMFGIFFAVIIIGAIIGVITGVSPTEYVNITILYYAISAGTGIYYMRKWSKEWNAKF